MATQVEGGLKEVVQLRGAVLIFAFVLATRASGEESAVSVSGSDPDRSALTLATVAPSRAPPAHSSEGPGEMIDESRYGGTYVYTGGESERAAVKAAVDRATEHMFGKVIARDELMKRSEVRPSYTIRLDGSRTVSIETPGFPAECSPLDGSEVVVRTKYGDVVKSRQQFVDGALVQSGRTDDGSGSTEFRLDPDGNTLRVTRVSRSPRLPAAVEFTLTYRRQSTAR